MALDGSRHTTSHTASHHMAVQQMRHALVINDPSERARLGGMSSLCADLRLDCRRIHPPGLEHASVKRCVARGRANCSVAHEQQRQCQAMTPKECSILLAHAMAWRALGRARPAAAVLILEDDATRSAAISPPRLRALLRSEPAAPVAQLGLCLPTWCFEHQHCACTAAAATTGGSRGGDGSSRGGEGSGGGVVSCRGLCAHAYRLTPEGAVQMLRSLASMPHAKVDLLFPHAPMLGGLDPCTVAADPSGAEAGGGGGGGGGGSGVEGDVGVICQNRSLAPMHDPALV